MAVTWESDTIQRTGTNYADFPENILIDPELNGRHENTDITGLVADILVHGQQQPVKFRKNDQGLPVLVYGHRRWRAIKHINDSKLASSPMKLFGNYESMSDAEAFQAAISENRFRRDVSPVDDAANIKVLVNRFKMTKDDIAKLYFPEATKPEEKTAAVRFVEQRIALIELAPEAAKAVRDGRIKSVSAAVHLAKLTKDQQRAKLADKPTGRVKGKDVVPTKSKAMTVRQLIQSLIKEIGEGSMTKGLAEVDNTANEYLSVDRKKFRKLMILVGANIE